MSNQIVEQKIFSLVCQVTGHSIEDLSPDLFLESDLGVDSIKIVELLNGLIQLVPKERQDEFVQAVPMTQLMELQTLAEIIDVVQDWLVSPEKVKETLKTNDESESPTFLENTAKDADLKEEVVDIIDSQYMFLITDAGICSCSVCSMVKLKGVFDLEIAQQSWQELILRHPMLRAYFVIPEEAKSLADYQLHVIKKPQPPAIEIIDLRNYDQDTQEIRIKEEVNQRINASWNIKQWPLHRFFVIRLEENVYELGVHHHHVLSDGLSNQIIHREFLEIYGAKLIQSKPNLPPSTSIAQYRQLVQSINDWQDPQADQALQKYLTKQGKDKFVWNPQNINDSFAKQNVCSLRYRLGQTLTKKLINRLGNWRLSLNCLLVGAYLKAISCLDELPNTVIMNIPTGGRSYPNVDATNFISCFAQNLALSFSKPEKETDWFNFLQAIQSEIQLGLAAKYDNTQTRLAGITLRNTVNLENGKIPQFIVNLSKMALKTNIFLSNMGQTGIKSQYGSFQVLDYRSASVTNPQGIDTLLEIFNDCLYINTNYDSNFFTENFMDSFMKEFLVQLEELANMEVQIQSPQENLLPLPQNQELINIITKSVSEICHNQIKEEHWHKDIETDLGIDSLELIRLIIKLEQKLGKKFDRQKLLLCRTLAEIAQVISPPSSLSMNDSNTIPSEVITQEVKPTHLEDNSNQIAIPYVAIAEQVKKTPHSIAIKDTNNSLTYQQLHNLSNQVAHYLRQQGIKVGDLVGIMTNRNSLMWIGILGILKAGAAYVPIDPAYPNDRISYMLDHAEIGILLTESQLEVKLTKCIKLESSIHSLVFLNESTQIKSSKALKQVDRSILSQQSIDDLPIVNTPDDLMVILYTSGSTGRPKGVMLNHRGYMNRLEWMQKAFSLKQGDRIAQKTSCCFDISIWEIFWPLMYGATVCPVAKEIVKSPWNLAQWLNQNQINVMHFVPSLFGEFVNALQGENYTFSHLRWLIFSGEALPLPFIQSWLDQYGNSTGLANLYGPTEASIDVSCHIIKQRPGSQGETSIPIGKAIDNVDLLILDANQQPLPLGEMGELWIGGVQLAKGYLKDPKRTAQAFCPNPFDHIQGKTLYRTGDLAKQLPDGSIEYHGRIDHQVKIRGFRVELGEIENVLLSHPAIQEAGVVVLDYELGQKRLMAGLAGNPIDVRELKEYLALQLTDYMIPHRLEWLTSLPKNHNGKLDRKALLAYFQNETNQPGNKNDSNPLKTESSPLKTKSTSLKCLPLGPAQRWLVRYFDAPYQWTGYSRYLYHQPLDLAIFNQAFNYLIERHWALRTICVQKEGQWWQQEIEPTNSLKAILYDGSHLSAEDRQKEIHEQIKAIGQELRIDKWPLIQVLIVKVSDTCYDINTIGHHIIGDLLSNQILFREFWVIYTQLLGGMANPLQDLPNNSSYADYVSLLMEQEKQGSFESHKDYWKSQFPNPQSTFQIPFDHSLGVNLEKSAVSEWFILSQDETKNLLTHAKKHYQCNVYDLLLAPLYRLMANWSGGKDVILSHRMHSRNLVDNGQFFESVGNFATNFPVGLILDTEESWEQLVQRIKTKFEEVPMNGITFDWLSPQLPSFMYPDNYLTPVRANYLGNRDIKPSSVFEFIKEDWDRRLSPPAQKRITLLEFFFSIVDGSFELQIEYSNNFHQASTIKQLGKQYISLLQGLLAQVPQPQIVQSASMTQPSNLVSNLDSLPLANQVAIVTGGDSEIGKAIAFKLANQGAKVAVIGEKTEQLQKTITQIQQWGGQALSITVDITKLKEVEDAIGQIMNTWQGINILVNNAKVKAIPSLLNSNPTQWHKILETKLLGNYHFCYTIVPYLLQQNKGKIINLDSDSSVISFTNSLAEELKPHNIQVNSVCYNFLEKDLISNDFSESLTPINQIAEVVSFFASPYIDSMTGECIKLFEKKQINSPHSKNNLNILSNINESKNNQSSNGKVKEITTSLMST